MHALCDKKIVMQIHNYVVLNASYKPIEATYDTQLKQSCEKKSQIWRDSEGEDKHYLGLTKMPITT